MLRELSARHRSWPLAAPFRISRGVKTGADVVTVEIGMMHWQGLTDLTWENYTPIALMNEDPAGVLERVGIPAGLGAGVALLWVAGS